MATTLPEEHTQALERIRNRPTSLTQAETEIDWLEDHSWDWDSSCPTFPRKNVAPKRFFRSLKISNSQAISALTTDCHDLLLSTNSFSWSQGHLNQENKTRFRELTDKYLVSKWGEALKIPINSEQFCEAMYKAFIRVRQQSRDRETPKQENNDLGQPSSSAPQTPINQTLTPIPSTARPLTHPDHPTLPQPNNPPPKTVTEFDWDMFFEFIPNDGGSPSQMMFEVTEFQSEDSNSTPDLDAVTFDRMSEQLRASFPIPEEATLVITLVDQSNSGPPIRLYPRAKAFPKIYRYGVKLAEKAKARGEESPTIRFRCRFEMPKLSEDVRQDVTTVAKRKRSNSVESRKSAQPERRAEKAAKPQNIAQNQRNAAVNLSDQAGGNRLFDPQQIPDATNHERIDLGFQEISLHDEVVINQPSDNPIHGDEMTINQPSDNPIHGDEMTINQPSDNPIHGDEMTIDQPSGSPIHGDEMVIDHPSGNPRQPSFDNEEARGLPTPQETSLQPKQVENNGDELPDMPEEYIISHDDTDNTKRFKYEQFNYWIQFTADKLTKSAFERQGIVSPTAEESDRQRKYFVDQLKYKSQYEDNVIEGLPSQKPSSDDENQDTFSSLLDNQRICEHISREIVEEAWGFFFRISRFDTSPFSFKLQGIQGEIFPHQMLGVYLNLKRGYQQDGQIIGDAAGLGKTIEILVTFWMFAWLGFIEHDIQKDQLRVKHGHDTLHQEQSGIEQQCPRAAKLQLPFRCPCHKLTPNWLSSHFTEQCAPTGFQLAIVPPTQTFNWVREWDRLFNPKTQAKVKMELLIGHEKTGKGTGREVMSKQNITDLRDSIDSQNNEDETTVKLQTNVVILTTYQSLQSQVLNPLFRQGKLNITFSSIAIDECHEIRSNDTTLANFLQNKTRLHCITEYTMLFPASGTPLEKGPLDLKYIVSFFEYKRNELWSKERVNRMQEEFPDLWNDLQALVRMERVHQWQASIQKLRGLRTGTVARGESPESIRRDWASTLTGLHQFLPLIMMKRALETNWLGKPLVQLPKMTPSTIITEPSDEETKTLLRNTQAEAMNNYKGAFTRELNTARKRGAQQLPNTPNEQKIISHLRRARQLCGNPFYAKLLDSGEFQDLNVDSLYQGKDSDAFWIENPESEETLARNPLMGHAAEMWKANFRVQKIWPIIKEILSKGEKVVILSTFPSTVAAVATLLSWKCAKDKLCKLNPKSKRGGKSKYPIRVGVFHSKLTVKERNAILYSFNGAQKISSKGEPQWNQDDDGNMIPEPFVLPHNQIDIFVGGVKVAGTGLNLQSLCSKLFIMEPLYTYQETIQANGRIYRIGQRFPTTVYQINSPSIPCEATVADRKQFNTMIQDFMIDVHAILNKKVKTEDEEGETYNKVEDKEI
jgi:hypothetical protein